MKNIIKLLLIALIVSLSPITNVSFAYLMDNNKYYHIEAPNSQLEESIRNIKTYLANNNRFTPKFYSKPDDVKSVISFPFSLKPFEIKYIYTNKYQYLYNKTFSIIGDDSNIDVRVGAEYAIDNNSFVTLENSYQKGDSFNFKYSLELISKNKKQYRNIVVQLFNRSHKELSVVQPNNANPTNTMRNNKIFTQQYVYATIEDNVSLVKIGTDVQKYLYPENRMDVGFAINNGIESKANSFIKYSLSIPTGTRILNASLDMSTFQPSCNIAYKLESISASWDSTTIDWNNQPSGLLIEECT